MRHHLSRAVVVGWIMAVATGSSAHALAPTYRVIKDQSTLSFVGVQQGEQFTGVIKDFVATVRYAASDLAGSLLDVVIHLRSLDTRSSERDQALATADWFAISQFPDATFRTVAIRQTVNGPVGDADLTIKGRTKRIAFPFVWAQTVHGATLDARVRLNRLDFGLGSGEWVDATVVGHQVDVIVHLTLIATPSVPATVAQPLRR